MKPKASHGGSSAVDLRWSNPYCAALHTGYALTGQGSRQSMIESNCTG